MEQRFPVPIGNLGGYKLKTIPTHDLDSACSQIPPLSCVTAYHCAMTMSEKIVHLMLSPLFLQPQILVIYHHVVLFLSHLQQKQTPGWVGYDLKCYRQKKKTFSDMYNGGLKKGYT